MRALMAGLAGLATVAATQVLSDSDAEKLFLQRVQEIASSGRGELSRYDPVEPVVGAPFTPLPAAAPSQRTIAPAALQTAADYAARNRSNAFIVWRDGRIEQESYFGGATATTPIVSKSLAKPLTAIAIGRAIALGRIKSLDQPVTDFITEWRGTPKAAIRIRHLLDMRSGLLAQGFNADPQNIWNRAYLHPYHERVLLRDYPLTDAPGSKYEYSNATSELVAIVIERATGRRYADFIGQEVLKPIGAAGGEVFVNRVGGLAHSGCCIMMPAQSWVRLARLVLDDGRWNGRRLLPAGYVGQMKTGTPANPYYGMGLWVAARYTERRGFANPARGLPGVLHSQPYLAADTVMFDGNSNQIVYIVPSQRLIVLRTGDSPPKSPEWDNAMLINTVISGITVNRGASTPQPR